MGKFDDYIDLILTDAHLSKSRRSELSEEMKDHLELSKKEFTENGFSEEEAEEKAIERFGTTEEIKVSLKEVFTPYVRIKEFVVRHQILKESFKWSVSVFGALLISLSIRSYAFASAEVEQCSMQSTLYAGQRLIESKLEYYFTEPKRGDIVIIDQNSESGVFNTFISNTKEFINKFNRKDDERIRLIKRVIGVPGDTIDIRDKKVYINGELLDEPYIKGETYPKSMVFPLVIPEHQFFVMGDNRENSMDSRDFGFVGIHQIEGKAVLRLWPIEKFGTLSS